MLYEPVACAGGLKLTVSWTEFGFVKAARSSSDPENQQAHTYIQVALQQSGHTETSSRVRVHMCRTSQLRLSMTSSSIWAAGLRCQSVHRQDPMSHTKTRSRSRLINLGLSASVILQRRGAQRRPPSPLSRSDCRCLSDEVPPAGVCSASSPVCVLEENKLDSVDQSESRRILIGPAED